MSTTVGETALVLLVGALAVTAGCQGVLTTDGTPTAEPRATAAATPTDASGPSPTPEATVTASPTATPTPTGTDFLNAHATRLRAAGNVTVNTTTVRTVSGGSRTNELTQTREARIDFESGRAYTEFEPLLGSPKERYRNESGATFSRTGTSDYFGPERSHSSIRRASSPSVPSTRTRSNGGVRELSTAPAEPSTRSTPTPRSGV
ncbi:hypothetical protein ACFQL4_16190 [Halosimplex aquaticum]